jgi:hypothetical protein
MSKKRSLTLNSRPVLGATIAYKIKFQIRLVLEPLRITY